jgi:HK97 family phage prohead protease
VLAAVDPSYVDDDDPKTAADGLEHKSFEVKELDTAGGSGEFEALVAVFGNVDRGGDRMLKGSFADTLATNGYPPVVWSHMWDTPPIGASMKAEETDAGLVIGGKLFVDDHEIARQVYAGMSTKGGDGRPALREFSFGYSTVESKDVTEDGQTVREIAKVDLYEVGPTLVGMNPATRLLGVKRAGLYTLDEARSLLGLTRQADNPAPNAAKAAEEARARIGRLLTERPYAL